MEKSFSSWREPKSLLDIDKDLDNSENSNCEPKQNVLVEESASDSETEVVASSPSNDYVPDSDESFNVNELGRSLNERKKQSVIVPDSDEQDSSDEDNSNNFSSLSGSGLKQTNGRRKKSSLFSANNLLADRTPEISDDEESSPEITKSAKRKNKKFVISSDEDNSSLQDSNFNISDVLSDEDVNSSTSTMNNKSLIDDHSSNDSFAPRDNDLSLPKIKDVSATSRSKLPMIDLTLPIDDGDQRKSNKNNAIDLSGRVKSDVENISNRKGVITISSDSEDDKIPNSDGKLSLEKELNFHLTKLNLSYNNDKKQPQENKNINIDLPTVPKNSSENDYSSRLESLKAEQTKLEVQVKEVVRNIETIKTTLKTANLAALPDKGVRLQMNLKKCETNLRDLRYQQGTLANEIIRLQLMPNKGAVPKPIQQPYPQPKIFKLPTSTTNINEMGKKALETHRTQQALTVDALRALHNSLKNCPSEDMLTSDPQGLKVELMPHQQYALSWLMWRESEKPSGGILADDMGLGKTLTMISLILKSNEVKHEEGKSDESENEESSSSNWLSTHRAKSIRGKTLVVCPASLLGQWEGEVQRRVKRGVLDTVVHHGQNREKRARSLAKTDFVITTYNIISRDADQVESPLFQIKWDRIILDEAHQIRNHKTKTAQAVFRLKARARWVLTGTPVQNKELDLYALLKFLRCSPFDDLGVWKTWVDNRDAAGGQRLNTIIKSIMLRRTKKGLQEVGELKSLPEKKLNTVMIVMDKEEKIIYEKLLYFSKTLFATYLHQKAEKENALQGIPLKPKNLQHAQDAFKDHPELARLQKKMNQISDVKSHHILVLLLRLRQFCCHPSLVQTMLDNEDISNGGIEDSDGLDIDLVEQMTRMSITNHNQHHVDDNDTDLTAMDKDNPLFAKDRLSSKMRKVVETIEAILTSNDKLLIVSQWVTHLDLIHSVLKEKSVKCLRLTGQIPVKDRAEVVDKFNRKDHGPRVLLLSLTAGGVGLNLIGANHLLLLDLHWNPQLESQAFDRIYRVGQEKDVQIYKFVTSDTVEENVLGLQNKKLSISDSVLTGAKKASSKLTLDDLKMLFKIN
ncbi:transcription termination factor 2 [Macrosteles quadrilineatus]|uniref:transcription termination factor 2 n=1 Tax=Macrosteles quadrilineatus TaxID=74068 RepID=UPI0023E2F756|nr:transcription termination factor 2 [Macrosteles quadrilineatus]